jgi:HEAT repeat protein
VKEAAAISLGKLCSQECPAILALLEAVADASQAVQKAAVTALQGLTHPDNVANFSAGLRSPIAASRVAAGFLLGQLGTGATSAADDLRKALADEAPCVRLAAAKALANLGALSSVSPSTTDTLVDLLKTQAAETVNRRVAANPAGFGFAHATLQETDIAWALARVENQLGPLAQQCTPEFLQASSSSEPLVASLAAAWIARRNGTNPGVQAEMHS